MSVNLNFTAIFLCATQECSYFGRIMCHDTSYKIICFCPKHMLNISVLNWCGGVDNLSGGTPYRYGNMGTNLSLNINNLSNIQKFFYISEAVFRPLEPLSSVLSSEKVQWLGFKHCLRNHKMNKIRAISLTINFFDYFLKFDIYSKGTSPSIFTLLVTISFSHRICIKID